MVSRREEHEAYLTKVLSNSLSSENPSKETFKKAEKNSASFFAELKNGLLNKYEGKSFNDFENTSVCCNDFGETLKIITKEKTDFNLDLTDFKNDLTCDLKIINGIGPNTEKKLKQKGYNNISSLLEHDKYANKAEKVLNDLNSDDFTSKINFIKENSKNKDNLLKCACEIPEENFKFMDIETLGLSNVPIILIGLAEIKEKNIITHQYLLRDKSEEPALISEFLKHLNSDSVFVTFNGKSFDVPYIKNRAAYYRIDYPYKLINYDLMYYARNLWKDTLPNCQLQTIEREIFNIKRDDDVPGAYIPGYWETYHAENNIGPLVPIVEHNRLDVVNLAKFLKHMFEETCSV
jgi:uncharacterized protein YprB with RNaseH-like and TPR domain